MATYPGGVATVVIDIIRAITLALAYGGAVLGVFSIIDVVPRRADAFVAADKQTKGTWLAIVIASGAGLTLAVFTPRFQPQSLLWLAALIGIMVYLVDVRPRLKQVSGGRR